MQCLCEGFTVRLQALYMHVRAYGDSQVHNCMSALKLNVILSAEQCMYIVQVPKLPWAWLNNMKWWYLPVTCVLMCTQGTHMLPVGCLWVFITLQSCIMCICVLLYLCLPFTYYMEHKVFCEWVAIFTNTDHSYVIICTYSARVLNLMVYKIVYANLFASAFLERKCYKI